MVTTLSNGGSPGSCEVSDDYEAAGERAVRAHLLEFLHSSRFLAPAGNGLGAVFASLVIHESVPRAALTAWLAAAASVALGLLLALSSRNAFSGEQRRVVPTSVLVAHAASGLLWGVLPWLSTSPDNSEFRWIALCYMFAISAGAMGGISGMTVLTGAVLIPMWFVGAGAFLASGQYSVAAAMVVFAGLVLRTNRSTARLLIELIRLRVDSTERAARARWEASHDPLTGLPNRVGLAMVGAERVSEGRASDTTTAMFVDLDHFKEVNDRFGHPVGDAVLADVAARLRHTIRHDDVVGRLSGDEFLVLAFRRLPEDAAAALADRIIEALEVPFRVGDDDIYISASIGITRLPLHEADVDRLVRESDKALYHAKRSGRRQAVVFDGPLEEQLRERSGLEMALRRAIRSDEIEAWGQPVFELTTGRVVWIELLARWEPTPGSFVPPNVFIPLAEEIGIVSDLDQRMMVHAADALAGWRSHPVLAHADAAVNVSALHIARGELVREVSELIACRDLRADRLIVEITESHRLAEGAATNQTLQQLVGLGVRLAVDDFGTGYSSLGQLLELPISIVKIDRSLTAGCAKDQRRRGVVAAVRQLATSLGQLVVAEGIEDPADRDAMQRLGMDQVQGYLFCPPLPLAALEAEMLRSEWTTLHRTDQRSEPQSERPAATRCDDSFTNG